ncbi:MAG: hypothetical protein IIU65_04590 [Clostridia bacterium]|nr:hypothetical protein [Clostridia bacterium]
MIYLILFLILFVVVFFLAFSVDFSLKKRQVDVVQTKVFDRKLSEDDAKMQNRVAKEIQNFLSYDGEVQDDIL